MSKSFKEKFALEQRLVESKRIKTEFTTRVPVVFERVKNSTAPELAKVKYLVPKSISMGQFMHILRRKLYSEESEATLGSKEAIFVFVGKDGNLPKMTATLSDLYNEYHDEDGFLYMRYSTENTFG